MNFFALGLSFILLINLNIGVYDKGKINFSRKKIIRNYENLTVDIICIIMCALNVIIKYPHYNDIEHETLRVLYRVSNCFLLVKIYTNKHVYEKIDA